MTTAQQTKITATIECVRPYLWTLSLSDGTVEYFGTRTEARGFAAKFYGIEV